MQYFVCLSFFLFNDARNDASSHTNRNQCHLLVHLHHRDDALGSTLGIWILLLHVQKCQKSDSWLIIFKLGWIHPDTSLRTVAAAAAGWRARPQISPGGRHGGSRGGGSKEAGREAGSKKPGREGGKCSQQPSSDPALRSLKKIVFVCLFSEAVASGAAAMQTFWAALPLLPDHRVGKGQLGKLFLLFLLRLSAGQLEISHGGLTVPNMLAKPVSLYHRWGGN